jgi:uncharacterized protein
VQDADRLDAIGSIGIARCLFFSATHGGGIHQKSTMKVNCWARSLRKLDDNTASMHFTQKLFRIPNLMKTSKGKEMALERMNIMHMFLEHLEKEW